MTNKTITSDTDENLIATGLNSENNYGDREVTKDEFDSYRKQFKHRIHHSLLIPDGILYDEKNIIMGQIKYKEDGIIVEKYIIRDFPYNNPITLIKDISKATPIEWEFECPKCDENSYSDEESNGEFHICNKCNSKFKVEY